MGFGTLNIFQDKIHPVSKYVYLEHLVIWDSKGGKLLHIQNKTIK